ncbi:hypothetical protein [Haloplanus aerogenes]|uniref:DUF8009 domain-containing protein n=1 Tax=Haloplanus aerogenes TaxID=660522 RepID=A0A3M0DSS7_9EURY|nr:hypothetical protein [Haloplanus aerogenes]AZH25447.1 hypothetical protein DU502_08665 [Haloplanus aerogenes]RMB25159.1 hypothetical protein ATH50_0242 [Haloplanus aerogenes]
MDSADADPTAIRSIAVTVDDVVTALESTRRSDHRTVLRITPPFSGRMRARLHRPNGDETTGAIHLDPTALVADPPPYPDPDETADRLREAGKYTTDRHHDRHAAAVRDWRAGVREAVVDAVDLPTGSGPHRVEIKRLG